MSGGFGGAAVVSGLQLLAEDGPPVSVGGPL